jgi:ABC-type glycerol-3-phosphate transport system substrate-binding protein
MGNLRPFQIVLLGGFGLMAFVALIFLGGYKATPSDSEVVYGNEVIIWGTLEYDAFDALFRNISQEDKAFGVVKYYSIDERDFDDQLINAIAEGRSPDMVVLSADDLVKHRAKLLAIPYESMPIGDYRSTYVDGAEIFALRDGVYAVPFAVDPLMMYWNRDLFASNAVAQAPRTWEEIVANIVPRITVRDSGRNVSVSSLAFGEVRNVLHAKEVLALLALQSGSKMVGENDRGYTIELNQSTVQGARAPLEAAVQFYTDFSNANSPVYSWNRAMPLDKNAFISGDLALYFGFGSEAEDIDRKNPNLNFDVTSVPQGGAATALRTYGAFYGFAIPRAAANAQGAFAAATTIASPKYASELTQSLNLAPVRRDLVAQGDPSPYRSAKLQAALIARGWLDPDPSATLNIFTRMVEDVVSNRARVGAAVSDAIDRLTLEY